MGNTFIDLPAPAGNGAGAWTDISGLGAVKTFVAGSMPNACVTIEITNEAAATVGNPLISFLANGGKQVVTCAAIWARVVVSGYLGGGAPDVDVGGNDTGATRANLAVPASSGSGAATDTSALGGIKTITVGGAFTGSLIVEVSEDGTAWAPLWVFTAPDQKTINGAYAFRMRVTRSGVTSSGTPVVNVAACESGGGGGGASLDLIRYTANGTEGDSITIPLTAARATATYFVFEQGKTCPIATKVTNIPMASQTLNDFVVELSSPADAGDVFEFLVTGA